MNTRRSRGRGNPRGGRHPNFRNQQLDSNGPEGRIRGTANQIHDRYLVLARDAQAVGDTVLAENLLQHAEHYFRLMSLNGTANPQNQPQQQFGRPRVPGEDEMRDEDEGFEPAQPGQGEPGRRDDFGREGFRREGHQREGFQRDQRGGHPREGYQRDQREGYQRDHREGYQRDHREGQQRDQREGYQRDQREGYQRDQRDRYPREQREGYQRDQEAGRQPRAEGGPPPRRDNDRPAPEQPGYSRREVGNNGPEVLPRRFREGPEAEPRRARDSVSELPSFLAPPPQSGNGAGGRAGAINGVTPAEDGPVRQSYAPAAPESRTDDPDVATDAASLAEDNGGRPRRRRETGEASGEVRARPRRRRPAGEDGAPSAEGGGSSELPHPETTG